MKTGALLLLISTFGAFAQFPGQTIPGQFPGQYPPGQYPPGQYPGNGRQMPGPSLPGRSRTSRKADATVPTDTVTGMLRKTGTNEIVIEPADKRIIHVTTNRTTKYVTTDGTGRSSEIQSSSLEPGDHLTIQAVRDDQSYFVAVQVRLDKKGTASEKAAASEPLGEIISTGTGSQSDSDDDRPRLKRSGASADAQPAAPKGAPAVAAAPVPEPVESSRPATMMEPAPAPRDSDDPGPPVLRRNRTLAQRSEPATQRTEIAQAETPPSPRPSLNDPLIVAPPIAEADPVVIRRPQQNNAPPGEDPIITAAREAADSFTETLPNYVVKQMTTRYQTEQAAGQKTSWQALDVVTADLVMENGRETYKNILVNGKAPKQALEKSGSWSNGEFASMLQLVLYRGSDAEFHGKRSSTIVNRAAWRYDYSVEQPNSHWTLEASGQSYEPAYSGAIWIDKETSRVLRIEMAARRIPSDFPLDSAESTVDYDFVLLGDKKFLVPTHSEVLSCQRGTRDCSRNVIEFRNYRKFGADSTITFEKDPR
jgi:hypothetical protein